MTGPSHLLIVHQHLYQPPREDPWLEVVSIETSAVPDHDWNTRINRECYARLGRAEAYRKDARAAARDGDARAGLSRIVNLYAWCSFDAGATLCEWLDSEAPDTMRAMVEGDAAGVRRWGHGNAMAAPYHHVILPLASPRERRTEIRWGLRDFKRRFGRDAEGIWLPECAADDDTLDAVAAEGVRFTILAPYQVHGHDDSGMPVLWRGPSGRTLTIVPYDSSLAGDVAFGGLLGDPGALAHRFTPYRDQPLTAPRCTTLATDGETFGHHHKNGDAALLEALSLASRHAGTQLTNAAALVAHYPATREVDLVSPSAWSCAHGVERWRSNCGCRLDSGKPPLQQWREPLRRALEGFASQAHDVYAREGAALFVGDPWEVRDAYGEVVGQDGNVLEQFARSVVYAGASNADVQRVRELLELQRATLRLFTSCAWFFDEVDRIEVRQVLRYAARALELTGEAARLSPDFVQALTSATNGHAGAPTAAEVFVREALPQRAPALCVAAAAMALAASLHDTATIARGESTPAVSPVRIGTFDVEYLQLATPSWRVRTTHRRTGAVATFTGRVEGVGPSQVVHVAPENGASEEVRPHEYPEAIARQVLGASATDDVALLGAV